MSIAAVHPKSATTKARLEIRGVAPVYMVEDCVVGLHPGHNSAAALIENGNLVFAQQEERLTRIKNQGGLPKKVLMEIGKGLIHPVDNGVRLQFALAGRNLTACPWRREDILRSAGAGAPTLPNRLKTFARRNAAVSNWTNQRKWDRIGNELERTLGTPSPAVTGFDHHFCHAASAYFGWGRMNEKVLVLTCDGAGDCFCATVNIAEGGEIRTIAKVGETHSIGTLYAKVTYLSGMVPMEHEYKLMGLAPYAERSREAIKLSEEFDRRFAFDASNPLVWRRQNGLPPLPYSYHYLTRMLERHRFDHLAAGLQLFVERFLVRWVQSCIRETGIYKLALSGGVFMNVKANQKILALPEVEELFICPSCGDETNAMGAAWLRYRQLTGQAPRRLGHLYLGSEYDNSQVETAVRSYRFSGPVRISQEKDVEKQVALLLSQGAVVARFKGKMEFGARSLGNRSILSNPAAPGVAREINEMIKCRDFWMPFAPSVLAERSEDYFRKPKPMKAPYMIITFDSREEKRNAMAAALHPYDYTGRPQEVDENANPDYYRLLKYFEELTGEGIILNTSFNLHGEPMVCSPEDALRVFDISGLQHLALEDFLLSKR